ncbi:MAG: serine/threonine-protein kinase, partial [Planctomycetota bacterium]
MEPSKFNSERDAPEDLDSSETFEELETLQELLVDWEIAQQDGIETTPGELCRAAGRPDLETQLRQRIEQLSASSWMMPDANPPAGILLDDVPQTLDRYQILGKIGSGGMGTVYRGRHQSMDRTVAIKTLGGDHFTNKEIARFQSEIRIIAGLNHPNIVTAFDALEVDGRPYLVMEYVEGIDLQRKVHRDGPLHWNQVSEILRSMADALMAAHDAGVIHRDIKPSNILLTKEGNAKLLDLGVSRIQPSPTSSANEIVPGSVTQLTGHQSPVGTLAFMSPEQAVDAGSADAQSDIYSLGCTVFWLLSGRPLFSTDSVVAAIVGHRETPAAPRVQALDIPPAAQSLLQAMLQKQPASRPKSMAKIVDAIDGANTVDASGSFLPNLISPLRFAIGSLVVFLLSLVLLDLLWGRGDTKDSSDR